MTHPEQQKRDEQAKAARAERKAEAMAILAVLGDPDGLLTPEQTRTWAFIRRNGFLDATTVRHQPGTGALDEKRMILNEGGRMFALSFLDAIRFAHEPEDTVANPAVPPVIRE